MGGRGSDFRQPYSKVHLALSSCYLYLGCELKTIPWPPWFPVVLNGRESGKRDVAEVLDLGGSL